MLSVTNVSKMLSNFRLQDISFALPKGYIMGLIGPNASGKTTLIKTLLNIYRPDSGNIIINGYNLQTHESQAKDCIGTILDENFFEEDLSAKENANLYGRYFSNYSYPHFESYCKQFDLDPRKKLKKYSKGMHMKFQLAFALSHQAKLLLLDEPTASLDPTFRKELMSILSDLISDGEHSVLLSTHLTEDLDQLADYITFINKGSIVLSKDKEALIDQYRVISCEAMTLTQLPKDIIVWKEYTPYGGKALIHNVAKNLLREGIQYSRPTLEDIMYYMVKGELTNVEASIM